MRKIIMHCAHVSTCRVGKKLWCGRAPTHRRTQIVGQKMQKVRERYIYPIIEAAYFDYAIMPDLRERGIVGRRTLDRAASPI